MLCERLIVSKCCCRWRQLSDCLMPPGERMCEFGHDCCLLKSWLLSTWPMASQFVMCAINYKAEKGTPIAKPKRAMKCAVTSNNELAAPSHQQSSTKPSHKSQAPWAGVCGCVGEYVCLPLCPASQSGKQPQSFIVVAGSSSNSSSIGDKINLHMNWELRTFCTSSCALQQPDNPTPPHQHQQQTPDSQSTPLPSLLALHSPLSYPAPANQLPFLIGFPWTGRRDVLPLWLLFGLWIRMHTHTYKHAEYIHTYVYICTWICTYIHTCMYYMYTHSAQAKVWMAYFLAAVAVAALLLAAFRHFPFAFGLFRRTIFTRFAFSW